MIKQRRALYRKFTRLVAAWWMLMLAWVPLRLGFWVRQLGYSFILKAMGKSVRISTGVEFFNPDLISLGSDVLLDRDVRLRPMGEQTTVTLGNGVQIDRGTDLKVHYASKGHITIGDHTIIGPYCFLSGESIQIGAQCLIAPQVGIFANNHEFSDPLRYIRQQGHSYKGIVIGDDCWVGAGAKILDGVTIGQGCVIGAGAVVAKSLPSYAIAVGIPAKIVGTRKQGDPPMDASITTNAASQSVSVTSGLASTEPLWNNAELSVS